MFKFFVATLLFAQISLFAQEAENIKEAEDYCFAKQEQCVVECEKKDGDISQCLDICDENLQKCLPKEN